MIPETPPGGMAVTASEKAGGAVVALGIIGERDG